MTVRMVITPREGISLEIVAMDMADLIQELGTAGITNALPIQEQSE